MRRPHQDPILSPIDVVIEDIDNEKEGTLARTFSVLIQILCFSTPIPRVYWPVMFSGRSQKWGRILTKDSIYIGALEVA